MTELISPNVGEVVSISKGKKHEISGSPSRTAKRLIGIDDLRGNEHIRYTEDSSGVEATPDDVLIAWDGANAGTIGFGLSGYIGSTIARLRINDGVRLFAPFFGLYLRSKSDFLRRTSTGATIPHIKRSALESIPLPKIGFSDQVRIAKLLGKVEGLIVRRKQCLRQLDGLLKGVFLARFGPGSPGYEDWPLVEVRELAAKHKGSMRTGPFGSNLRHSEFAPHGDVAVLGIDNAVQNRFAWGDRRFISNEKYRELKSYRVFPGDVIVTIMGTIGRSAVVPDDIPLAINTKHLAAITLDREVANPLFLSYAIHSSPLVLSQIARRNRGAIMSGLNLGVIKEIKIKCPPIDMQNQFAAIQSRVECLKASYHQGLADLKDLYGSLGQRAFKGGLDLSRMDLSSGLVEGDQPVAASEPAPVTTPAIELPSFDMLALGLRDRVQRESLLRLWLEAYCAQLGGSAFSLDRFIATVQSRLNELHPDIDLDWAASDYGFVKTWVFEALAAGSLTQAYDDIGNRVELKAAVEQGLV